MIGDTVISDKFGRCLQGKLQLLIALKACKLGQFGGKGWEKGGGGGVDKRLTCT